MKGKYGIILSLFLVIVLITTTAASAQNEKKEALKLSLEDAIRLALENNEDLKVLEAELQKQRTKLFQLNRIEDDFDMLEYGIERYKELLASPIPEEMKNQLLLELQNLYEKGSSAKLIFKISTAESDVPIRTIQQQYIDRQIEDVFKPAAKIALETIQSYLDHTENGIKLLAIRDYTEVLEKQKVVAAKEASLKRAQKQLEIARALYEEGMKAKDDYFLAQLQESKLKSELLTAKNELEAAKIQLKQDIGLDLEREITLTTTEFALNTIKMDLERDIEAALKNRPEAVKAKGNEETQRLNFEFFDKIYTSNVYDYQLVKEDYEQAAFKAEKVKKNIEAEIRKNYHNVVTARRVLEEVKGNREIALKYLEIARLKYEAGLNNILDVYDAMERLAQVEEGLIKAKRAVQLAESKYLTDLGPQD